MYIYIYIYIYYIYIYIYIYICIPDQSQLKAQKWTIVACELKKTPYQSKTQGFHEKNIPHTAPRKHTMLSWPASGYD